jgi:hypothetical protein
MNAILFLLLTLGNTSQKMATQAESNLGFRTQMNFIFAHLDKNKVPTGILLDYAMEFTDIEHFNGRAPLTDSNYANGNSFWQVYNTLLSSRISSSETLLVSGDSLDNSWYKKRSEGLITLCGLHITYAKFKDNAAPKYISIRNNQLYDKYVDKAWQNPYQTAQVFLVSPPVNAYSGLSFQVVLPSDLWIANDAATISIDLGDGLGFRELTPGTPLSVRYESGGLKEWTYQLQLNNCGQLYAHSLFSVGK